MQLALFVHGYDVMDRVQLVLHVDCWGENSSGTTRVLSIVETVAGVGESDAEEWAKDCLIALIERL